jgi:dTDP-4-dehydrorhamnose reductase
MKDKEIVILGSAGMLGQMVKKYFSAAGHSITCFDNRFNYESRPSYGAYLRSIRNAVVFNCIGKIKQKTDDTGDLLQANAILPAELRNSLHEDVILIHPSTDCVFNGEKGSPYTVTDDTDATDDYGWSKRLGEVVLTGRANTLIPRVSIIGPDRNPLGKGLLAWVMSNKPGTTIKGFTNHWWNGITTLEWCKQIEDFLNKNQSFEFTLKQYGTTEHYTKYDMVTLFNEIFDLKLLIEPMQTPSMVDRRLAPDIVCKSLIEQLKDIKLG